MSTKKDSAPYAVELTAKENGSVSITATPQEPSEGCFVQRATATSWVILETMQKLLSEEHSICGCRRP